MQQQQQEATSLSREPRGHASVPWVRIIIMIVAILIVAAVGLSGIIVSHNTIIQIGIIPTAITILVALATWLFPFTPLTPGRSEVTEPVRPQSEIPESRRSNVPAGIQLAPEKKGLSLPSSDLSETQKKFLETFLSVFGQQAIGEKISYVRDGDVLTLQWKNNELPTRENLFALVHLGYLEVYSVNRFVIFTKRVLELTNGD